MTYKVLTEQQVEQFIELGWVKVEEAFPRDAALEGQNFLWQRLAERGVIREDRSTWTQPMVRINEAYNSPEFHRCNSKSLADAIEDLVGAGRWEGRSVFGETEQMAGFGWWPVNFAMDADRPWTVPNGGWHWDGIHFKHHIDSPEQGLLCLCLFSETGPQGGGTLIAEGSHKLVAKFLAAQAEGLELGQAIRMANQQHPWLAELTGTRLEADGEAAAAADGDIYADNRQEASKENTAADRIRRFMNWHTDADGVRLRVVEATGSPGDALLCHPFLYHASSQNHSGVPRFMCNRTTPLSERLQLTRENPADYSPLERSIRTALAGNTPA